MQGALGNWTWTGTWKSASSLQTNAWNEISVTLPTNAVTPLDQLGVEVKSSGSWTGTVYVDAVTF